MCSAKRFSLIARALEVLFLSNEIEFERVGEAPSDRRRQHLLESAKRKKCLFCQTKWAVTLLTRAIQITCFWRLRAFRSTKIILPSPANSQALQIQCFQKLRSTSFDQNSTFEIECSQTLQIECFWRLRASRSTKIVLLAPRALRHYKKSAFGVSGHLARRK